MAGTNRTYSVKFKSEGLQALIKDLKQAGQIFDEVLAKSQAAAKSASSAQPRSQVSISPKVDLSGVKALNAELVSTGRQLDKTQRLFESNPIAPKVDLKGLQQLHSLLEKTSNTDGEIRIKTSIEDQKEFLATWKAAVDNFFTRLPKDLKGVLSQNRGSGPLGMIQGGVGFAAQSFLFGAFSKFGESLSEDFSRGFSRGLQQKLGINFRQAGQASGSAVAGYPGAVVKSFQRPEDAATFRQKLGELLVAYNQTSSGFGQPGSTFDGFKSLAAALVKLNPGELQTIWSELSKLSKLPDLSEGGDDISGVIRQTILEYSSLAEGLELISKDLKSGVSVFRDAEGSLYAINAAGKDIIATFASIKEQNEKAAQLLGNKKAKQYDIITTVNGHVDSNLAKADSKGAISIAKEMKRQFDALLSQIDEAVLTNTPTNADSKGSKRGSIYQRFGFVPTEGGQQVAIVRGGRISSPNVNATSSVNGLQEEISQIFTGSIARRLPESFRQRVSAFRQAIASARDEVAKEVGELLLQDIVQAKQIVAELAENLSSTAEPGNIPAIESKQTATIRELSKLQSEILKGSKAAGRAPIGLQQLAQEGRITGLNIAAGVSQGVEEGTDSVGEAAQELGEAAIEAAEDTLDIQSPSKVFKRIGQFVGQGFIEGINSTVGAVREATIEAFDFGKDAANTLAKRIDEDIVQPKHINLEDFIENLSSDALDIAANGFKKLTSGIGELYKKIEDNFPLLKKFRSALIGFGAAFLANLGIEAAISFLTSMQQEAFKTAVRFEVLKNTIVGASGGIASGTKNIAFLNSEVRRLSLDLEAATEAYAALKAASQGTALEGAASDQIFSAVGEASVAKGLDPQQQQRVFLAIQQMISKGKVSAEELRQQLGEALPGALQTAARALGVTTQQLDKMLESGQLLATDFLPKFAAQLSAENSSGVTGAANSAQASITRFNNSITNFKKLFGETSIDANKLGLDVLATSIDIVNKNAEIFIKIFTGLSATMLLEIAVLTWKITSFFLQLKSGGSTLSGIAGILRTIGSLLRGLFPLFTRFLLVTAAIETWFNVYRLTQNSFKDIADYANQSAKGLDNLARAYRDAGKAASEFQPKQVKRDRDLISRGGPEIFGLKFNLDTMYRKPLDWIFEKFGGHFTTQGEREYNDFLVNASDLMARANENITQSLNAKNAIGQIQELDKQLETIRSQRFEILPGDRAGLEKSIQREQALLKEREKLLKITSTISTNFARDSENIKKTLEAIERLPEGANTDRIRTQLEDTLNALQQSQTAFDNLVSSVSRSISESDRRLRNLTEGMSQFNDALERNGSLNRARIIQDGLKKGLFRPQIDSQLQDYSFKETQIKFNQLQNNISQIQKDLKNPIHAQSLQNLGINPDTVGSEQLERMLGEGRGSQEQSTLKTVQKLKQLQQEAANAEYQLAQAQQGLQEAQVNYFKQLFDFWRQLKRQFEDLRVQTSDTLEELRRQFVAVVQQIKQTRGQTAFTALKAILTQPLVTQAERLIHATNDAFEQYLNSLTQEIEQAFSRAALDFNLEQQLEQINNAITDANKAQRDRVQNLQRQQEDTSKQWTELEQQSPVAQGGAVRTSSPAIVFPVPGSNAGQNLPGAWGMMDAPRDGGRRRHGGIDYQYPTGTPLITPFSGTVARIDTNRGEYQVILRGIDEKGRQLEASMAHLSEIFVKAGERFEVGKPLGKVGGDKGSWGSTGAHLDLKIKINGQAVDPRTFFGNASISSQKPPTTSQNNLAQYLARIAAGESSGGKNLGDRSRAERTDAPYGEYQFRKSTRNLVLQRHRIDAWSSNKEERDRAAISWIEDYGKEIGVDILQLIQAGNFPAADRLLGRNQFTSLPGGAEASPLWRSAENLRKYGPVTNGKQLDTAKATEQTTGEWAPVLQQSQQNLSDSVNQDLSKSVEQSIAATSSATQQHTAALEQQKSAVTDLTEAQRSLSEVEARLSAQQRRNNLARYLEDTRYGVESLTKQVADLEDKYQTTTPLRQHEAALREIDSEYLALGRNTRNQLNTLTQQRDRFEELTKILRSQGIPGLRAYQQQLLAAGNSSAASQIEKIIQSVNEDAKFLENKLPVIDNLISSYQEQLDRLGNVYKLAKDRENLLYEFNQRSSDLEKNKTINQLDNQLREVQATLLGNTYGRKTSAADLERKKALTEASDRYEQQKLELERDIKLNASKYTAAQIQKMQAALEEWFDATIEQIDRQFQVRIDFDQREYNLQKIRGINDIEGQLLGSKSQLFQNRGDEFAANDLLQQQAIIQENDRYQQQLFELEKDAAINSTKYSLEDLEQLKAKLLEINQINLQNIDKQFKDLGETIASVSEGALEEFFSAIFTNTKSIGEAFRDMALTILRSIAQIAAKQVVLSILGRGGGAFAQLFGLAKGGKVPAFATGGSVEGPGTGTSDSILAKLSNGEFVVRAAAVRHWGTDFLEDLNSMRSPRLAFAAESLGPWGNSNRVGNPTINMTVVTPDANSFRRSEAQVGRDAGEMYRRSLLRNG
jgi:tape measure domain-containing protein